MPVQWFVDLGIKEGIAEEVREESKILARGIRFIEANDTQTYMRFLSYKFGLTWLTYQCAKPKTDKIY